MVYVSPAPNFPAEQVYHKHLAETAPRKIHTALGSRTRSSCLVGGIFASRWSAIRDVVVGQCPSRVGALTFRELCALLVATDGAEPLARAGHLLTEGSSPLRWSTGCGCQVPTSATHVGSHPVSNMVFSLTARCQATIGGGDDAINTFFLDTGAGEHVPRAIFVDFWSTGVDGVRTSTSRQLFHPERPISGKEDAANNFARGHHTIGWDIFDLVLERTRKLAENCTGPQGFLRCLLLKSMAADCVKKSKLSFVKWACPQIATAVVELCNTVMCAHSLLELTDLTVVLDNEISHDGGPSQSFRRIWSDIFPVPPSLMQCSIAQLHVGLSRNADSTAARRGKF